MDKSDSKTYMLEKITILNKLLLFELFIHQRKKYHITAQQFQH